MEALPAPVGIFDSGIGGLSILKALRAELPGESFVYLADNAYAPYGERGDAFVTKRTLAITQFLRAKHQIKALVIACNTATAAAIHHVRAAHPDLPVVGVEPALKPAVQASKTKRIGVMATRGTVESAKFQALVTSLQGQAEFIVHPCDGLAAAIEQTGLQADLLNATNIRAICERHTRAIGLCDATDKTMDTLVLGCTHYPFAAEMLQALMGQGVQLIDNGAAVARQTRRLLANAAHLSPHNHGLLMLLATGETATLGIAATNSLPSPQAPLTENVIQVTC